MHKYVVVDAIVAAFHWPVQQMREWLATVDCGFYLNGAAFAMQDWRHHRNSRVLVYGMYNTYCPPPKTKLVSCSVDLCLKSGNLTVGCDVDETETLRESFAGLHHSKAFTIECNCGHAALAMHKHRDEVLAVRAVVHYQSKMYSAPLEIHRAYHRVRICTKAYGNGGRIGDEVFLRWWMKQWQAMGVSDVVIYVLDTTVPRSLENFVAQHPQGTRLIVRNWPPIQPYTKAEYESQSETAAAEIEVSYRTAMAHCTTDARTRMDWVVEVDTDELVVLGPKSRPNTSLGMAVVGAFPPPGILSFAAFELPCERIHGPYDATDIIFGLGKPWVVRPKEWQVALGASVDTMQRVKHQQEYDKATGWKSMWRPTVARFVTAHGMGSHGKEDEQMNHLVHVETAYIVHCR